MSAPGRASLGARRGKREVIDVAERRLPDRRLDQLLHVRKQRLSRLERERNEALQSWRLMRKKLHGNKLRWRRAQEEAREQWEAARQSFTDMVITSGEFRRAKAVYERMKKEAIKLRLDCKEIARASRAAGQFFFEAQQMVQDANKQQEKLGVLRDELRAAEAALEAQG